MPTLFTANASAFLIRRSEFCTCDMRYANLGLDTNMGSQSIVVQTHSLKDAFQCLQLSLTDVLRLWDETCALTYAQNGL